MKAVGKIVEIAKAINNSKGMHDVVGWTAHGATEAANLLVHGHAAPMYAHGTSPPDQGLEQAKAQALEARPDPEHAALDVQNVSHSDPITPGPTPGQAKMERANAAMQSRMNNPQPQQSQEMSR